MLDNNTANLRKQHKITKTQNKTISKYNLPYKEIFSGIPQGSILAPYFLLYCGVRLSALFQ